MKHIHACVLAALALALGVPCANLSSNGPHLHYHQPGDTIYRINPDMLADVARLTFLSAYGWANR